MMKESAKLLDFVGQRITLFCLNYIYTGELVAVHEDCVELKDAAIVYETGAFDTDGWKDAQNLPKPVCVMQGCIESFMILK